MFELGLALEAILPWFTTTSAAGYARISVPPDHVSEWPALLADAVRRAYISDAKLEERAVANGMSRAEVLATKLPDPGSIMSGDFGEILAYVYLAGARQGQVVGPKRWRLKEARTKSAPYSDVVQFVLPHWPAASNADMLICAEVKAKATRGAFTPIADAIAGMKKDRTSRLSKTLVWLRERAVSDDIGAVTIPQLQRFINASEFPPYTREFNAIAVICSALINLELAELPALNLPAGCALIVIDVPQLRNTYTAVYQAAHGSVPPLTAQPEVG